VAYPFKPFATEKSRGDPNVGQESNSDTWKPTEDGIFRTSFQPKNQPDANCSHRSTTSNENRVGNKI